MRNSLYFLAVAAIVFSLTWQSSVTSASNQLAGGQQQIDQAIPQVQFAPLLNYDVREEIRAASPRRVNQLGVAVGAVDSLARQKAIESFSAQLSSDARKDLQVVMDDSGLPKMVFNRKEPLSAPRSGEPDSIARDFLAGHVMSVNEGLVIPNAIMNTTPRLSESEGMAQAFLSTGRLAPPSFVVMQNRQERGGRSVYQNPLGENRENLLSGLTIMRVGPRAVLAWHSYVDVGPNEWYEILVDANTGAMLYRYNLYADVAQGTVFRVNGLGQRTLVSFVGDTTINTAAGWMGASTVTTGNNVDAYLDTNRDNLPDAINTTTLRNGRAFSSTQNFSFTFTAGVDPRTQRAASVTNLFYFNNIMHDFAYRLGFTEAAGNFQTNNFGRGGIGNDPVRAEAQDGSGTNNANFATPPDGSRPRMQMFLFTRGTANLNDDRDGSFDGDVVLHEYGHGISNRLVGGPSNTSCLGGTQAGAMGEGWSDYWAITFYNNGIVGEYVTNNTTRGIRRAAYTVPANPIHDSYADLGNQGFEVHNDGEIWAAALWDLRQTLGSAIANRLVLQGMKFTPCSPSFLNARDGILTADQNLNS